VNCDEAKELLSPFLDRELTEGEMTAVAAHLEQCPHCTEHSTLFSQLSRVLKHWEGVRASEEARRALAERIRSAGAPDAPSRRTLPMAILALLAGALLAGGGGALVVYLLRQQSDTPPPRPAVARCVATAGRVEVVTDGIPVQILGERDLFAGQELRCNLGGAAQLELPGRAQARLLLRGTGRLTLGGDGLRLGEGALTFHIPAGISPPPRFLAGRWAIEPGPDGAVALVQISGDASVRLAVLSGSARLAGGGGSAGIPVAGGSEVMLGAGGELQPPRQVTDPREFDLIKDD
jgi:anti-sigma factor (TIGR02949 family)